MDMTDDGLVENEELAPEHVRQLVDNHDRFLAFLLPRVGSRDVAEEILQAAFVKGIEKSGTVRDGESVVAWFQRLLRNALVDYYRRRATQRRGQERYADENPEGTTDDAEIEGAVCACVGELIPTLKPEYAEILRRVELDGATVAGVAADLGVTANNAGVRLHRAREALRKRLQQTCGSCTEHGCLDCNCKHH